MILRNSGFSVTCFAAFVFLLGCNSGGKSDGSHDPTTNPDGGNEQPDHDAAQGNEADGAVAAQDGSTSDRDAAGGDEHDASAAADGGNQVEPDAGTSDKDSGTNGGGVTTCADDPCDALVSCKDSSKGRKCGACPSGYTGKGDTACVDLDECKTDNGGCGDATYFACTNNAGAEPSCADIDECATDNGGCGDATYFACANNVGAAPSCTDIDECATANGGCGDAAFFTCMNNVGGAPTCHDIDDCAVNNGGCGDASFFKCTHNVGGARSCADVDECAINNGGCGAATFYSCTNQIGAAPVCKDIDECATNNGSCGDPKFYSCENNTGAAPQCGDIGQCATNNGGCGDANFYRCSNNVGAAPSCTDIDECATNNGGCGNGTFTSCTNHVGAAPSCADINECNTGNGGCGDATFNKCTNNVAAAPSCTDIDECATSNGGCGSATFTTCLNNVGAAPTCTDIDECATSNGSCGDATFYKCANNVGAAPTCTDIDECATSNGGCGSATFNKCANNVGTVPTCTDIDECATSNGGCGSATFYKCTNNVGALASCTDIDECATNHGGCDPLVTCANNTGAAASCGACPSGYTDTNGNGTLCMDIDECAMAHGGCDSLVSCTNNTGAPASCGTCPSGYTDTNSNGTLCTDIDECATNNGNCLQGEQCVNAPGSSSCGACTTGYLGAGFGAGCQVSALDFVGGERQSCALLGDHSVRCWGNDAWGQLGLGLSTASTVYSASQTVVGLSNVTQISGGARHECALLSDNTVRCWGYNSLGQVGDGTNNNGLSPVAVLGLAQASDPDVTMIASGSNHNCAVMKDGTARCWGDNTHGQLGNNASAAAGSSTPVTVLAYPTKCNYFSGVLLSCATDYTATPTTLRGVRGIAAGLAYTCTLGSEVTDAGTNATVQDDDIVRCFGQSSYYQLGNNATTERHAAAGPVVGLPNAQNARDLADIRGGSESACALTSTGAVYCWGRNTYGVIGDGTNTVAQSAVHSNVSSVKTLRLGYQHACALQNNGQALCWGRDNYGQLGDGATITDVSNSTPTALATVTNASLLGATYGTSCVLDASGSGRCFGLNNYGQLGDGTSANSSTPVRIAQLKNGLGIALGERFSCALDQTGGTHCWGRSTEGELGIGNTQAYRAPLVTPNLTSVAKIVTGHRHACALLEDQTVKCWGGNPYGETGVAAGGNVFYPTAVTLSGPAIDIAAGYEHTCAVIADGHVECWGRNSNGQFGVPASTTDSATPVSVPSIDSATTITAGAYHSCVVRSNKRVACWGLSRYGAAGLNQPSPYRQTAFEFMGLRDARAVTGFDLSTCALVGTDNGNQTAGVYCWGRNNLGQLGTGTLGTDNNVPTRVNLANVAGLSSDGSATADHICALKNDGGVACWGRDLDGELGDGNLTSSGVPVNVIGLPSAVDAIGIGNAHSCALLSNGNAYCWGANTEYQIGDGSNVRRPTPVPLNSLF